MTKKQQLFFLICVVVQVVVVLGLFTNRFLILTKGREVVLRTVPIDPRDIIRGQYLALRYEIATLPEEMLVGSTPRAGDTVYVTLTQNTYNEIWTATQFSLARPKDFSAFIKAKVVRTPEVKDTTTEPLGLKMNVPRPDYQVEYDIEKYFVEDRIAKEFERSGRLKVYVSVDGQGNAVLKRAEPLTNADMTDTGVTSPASNAQLYIRDISHSPYIQAVGKPVTITVTLGNRGVSATPTTTLEIFVPGSREGQTPLTTYTVPSLRPNGIVTFKRVEEFAYPYGYNVSARVLPIDGLTPFSSDLEQTDYIQITKDGTSIKGAPIGGPVPVTR